jgi:hypothetical protein
MFKDFPNLGYISDNKVVTVKDIFRRVSVVSENINSFDIEYYTIQDGEQPEDVAYKLYGDQKLYWTILLVNNIIDPYNEWYISAEVLEKYTTEKYGGDFLNTVHHWVLPERSEIRVEYDSARLAAGEIIPVTNLEHETLLNDNRQDIQVVNKNRIRDFVKEFSNKIRR